MLGCEACDWAVHRNKHYQSMAQYLTALSAQIRNYFDLNCLFFDLIRPVHASLHAGLPECMGDRVML